MTGAALVTGASSGIGRATAELLAAQGWRVYAGVRRDADAQSLRESAPRSIIPLMLDVTDAGQIADASRTIGDGDLPLRALVNSAGVCVSAPVEMLSPDDLRRQLEINTIGAHAVTQAMLPMLIAKRGVIVNISSISGRIAFPMVGAYAASKFAMEALSDAMRVELRSACVRVCVVEPGPVRTPIWRKTEADAQRIFEDAPEPRLAHYHGAMGVMRKIVEDGESSGIPPERVAAVIVAQIAAKKPKARVLVGRGLRRGVVLHALLPTGLRDRIVARRMRL